ncbi:MAG: hypothetical protein OHK0039_11900 [Bacteroidia bacterium]
MMRLFLLCLLCCCIPALLPAQRAAYKPLRNELALQLGSVESQPAYATAYRSGLPATALPLPGLRYTFALSQNDHLRLGAQYRRSAFADSGFYAATIGQSARLRLDYARQRYQGVQRLGWSGGLVADRGSVRVDPREPQPDMGGFATTGIGLATAIEYTRYLGPRFFLTFELGGWWQRHFYDRTGPADLPAYVQPSQTWGIAAALYLGTQFGPRAPQTCKCPGH